MEPTVTPEPLEEQQDMSEETQQLSSEMQKLLALRTVNQKLQE